jgi:very-short-patch-repair endonuclease
MTTISSYPSPDVLVAIMNNQRDLEIARRQRWYRIPVNNANRFIPDLEQMQYLAFYQTQNFERDGCAVNYYAEIEQISTARRIELLPNQAGNQNAEVLYYKLEISPLERLSQPIPSKRLRRVTFITTTLEKFSAAQEINDLFHTSPIEDLMWDALKAAEVQAERQYEIRERDASYDLDFFVECIDGAKINIECNGDTYHSTKAARDRDRRRNTYLTTSGWLVQRFGTDEIRNDIRGCIDQIRTLIDRHGGPVDRSLAYDLYRVDADSQLDLFEPESEEETEEE